MEDFKHLATEEGLTNYVYDPNKTLKICDCGAGLGSKGVISAKLNLPGHLILKEEYIFRLDSDFILPEKFTPENENELARRIKDVVPLEDVERFLKMTPKYILFKAEPGKKMRKMATFLGRVRGFAIPLENNPTYDISGQSGIFFKLSYLNHSCRPNSCISYNASTEICHLYALEELTCDMEITISYLPTAYVDPAILKSMYAFKCLCHFCLSPESEAKTASNVRRKVIDHLLARMEAIKESDDVTLILKLGWELYTRLTYDNIKNWMLGKVFELCFLVCANAGDLERAWMLALLATNAYLFCEGPHSISIAVIQLTMDQVLDEPDHDVARRNELLRLVKEDGFDRLGEEQIKEACLPLFDVGDGDGDLEMEIDFSADVDMYLSEEPMADAKVKTGPEQ